MNRIDSRLALRKALGAVLSSAELEVQNREWLFSHPRLVLEHR